MDRGSAERVQVDVATAFALAAREGDENALISMIELTQADVWRFCAHLASPAEADDLTQETFVRAVVGLSRFRGRSTVRTWLLAIARRVVADAARAGARRRRLTEALTVDSPADRRASDRGRDPAEVAALADLVGRMGEDQRTAFVLTQVLGYGYADAAEVCGCPIGTIRSRVARARAELLRGLEGEPAVAPSPGQAMRRTVVTVLIAALALVVGAAPASAHSVAGQGATNYQSRIQSMSPKVAGLTVEIIEAGSRIKLVNHTGRTVSVLGYSDEPYLRVGADGVFENRLSPTLYTNAVRNNPPPPPAEADARAKPQWRRVSGGEVVRWHDHRVHWMGGQDPPIVKRAPGKFHVVVKAWRLKLVVGTQPVTVTGDLVWVPGPSPVPWSALALGAVVLVVAAAFTRAWRPAIAAATVLAIAADVVHTIGVAFASETGKSGAVRLITSTPYSLAAWVIGSIGLVLLFKRPLEGLYGVSIAALIIGGLGGLGDVGDLFRSQLASAVGVGAVRAAIALSLGLAVAIPAGSYIAVRRGHVPRHEPELGLVAQV